MCRARWISVAAGVLAGLGLHTAAHADDSSSSESSGSSAGEASESSDSGSASGDDTSSSSGDGGSTLAQDTGFDPATGPCLSISPPSDGCECTPAEDPAAPLALLFPVLALRRRGGQRERVEQLASAGRLPPDVIARLRARLRDGG